jgi:hypothetical protein
MQLRGFVLKLISFHFTMKVKLLREAWDYKITMCFGRIYTKLEDSGLPYGLQCCKLIVRKCRTRVERNCYK